MAEAAIELVGINKSFGAVHANRDIHLEIQRGTIHGIVGENGAGKSTLMSILYGFYQADSGEIRVGGKPMVDQHAERRHRGRHRHGPPALHAGREFLRARKRHPRRRGRAAAEDQHRQGALGAGAAGAGIRAGGRSGRDHRGTAGRPAAARRDPQGALSRRRHPDPRRADRRADAGRGRPSVPHPQAAQGTGQDGRPHHPQAARDHGDHRQCLGHAAGHDGGDARDQRRPRSRNWPS